MRNKYSTSVALKGKALLRVSVISLPEYQSPYRKGTFTVGNIPTRLPHSEGPHETSILFERVMKPHLA